MSIESISPLEPSTPPRQLIEPGGLPHSFTATHTIAMARGTLAAMESQALAIGYDSFLDGLNRTTQHDPETGFTSTLLVGAEPATNTAVLVGGFGMRPREVVLLAEYWRRIHQHLGRQVNVLAVDSPRQARETHLPKQDRDRLDNGDMGPFGSRLLQLVQQRCSPGSVEVVGYSYGNLLATALICAAAEQGINTLSYVSGALPNPTPSTQLRRTIGFSVEALTSRGAYPPRTPGIFTHKPSGESTDVLSVLRQAPTIQKRLKNHSALDGLAAARQAAPDMRMVFGFGTHDRIGGYKGMIALLHELSQQPGGEIIALAYEGLHHAWGRYLTLLGELAVISAEGVGEER